MRRVIIESPYAGRPSPECPHCHGSGVIPVDTFVEHPCSCVAEDRAANIEFAQLCMADCFRRGEAPFASHLLYTQCLDDDDPRERATGIDAGLRWGLFADASVVYVDRHVSRGMLLGIRDAEAKGRPVEYRLLGAKS